MCLPFGIFICTTCVLVCQREENATQRTSPAHETDRQGMKTHLTPVRTVPYHKPRRVELRVLERGVHERGGQHGQGAADARKRLPLPRQIPVLGSEHEAVRHLLVLPKLVCASVVAVGEGRRRVWRMEAVECMSSVMQGKAKQPTRVEVCLNKQSVEHTKDEAEDPNQPQIPRRRREDESHRISLCCCWCRARARVRFTSSLLFLSSSVPLL